MRFQGKRAIVTGAASGIGQACVEQLIAEGARVMALDRAEFTSDAELSGACDISDPEGVKASFQRAVDAFGGLDVCIANAGVLGSLALLEDLSAQDWLDVLRVNVVGTFNCVQQASIAMRNQGGGAIVCTASVAGLRSGAGPIPYSASKAAVINLVQTTAQQLAGSGVRVNAVCPGLVETGMTRMVFEVARARGSEGKIGQLNPLRRPGQPAEIAQAALFLASDASSYLNGQAIAVDGGLSSSLPVVPGRFM
ncbi:MAG: SDR family oxidoreductase [Polyangiaceae bacterium]|nr:SDR family oxidoreductase [Myxococcales bacterium]MCB9588487.1 SDR family oxidoreductase [Polyangiaceae bacterium]